MEVGSFIIVLVAGLALVIWPWGSPDGPVDPAIVARGLRRGRMAALAVGAAMAVVTAAVLLMAFSRAMATFPF
jgi:threonine/homoserine/homoserine lactone efflux protein